MIQQFQPKYELTSNTIGTETIKPTNNRTKNQPDVILEPLNTVVQMPYTIVTKVSPITDDIIINNNAKL